MKSLSTLVYRRSPILLHVGSCNVCTNSKSSKSRVNPPLKFHFPWKIFPNLYNPRRPPFSVPGSLIALLMFVLSAWVSWGVGSRRWGSSLRWPRSEQMVSEKPRSREREREWGPFSKSEQRMGRKSRETNPSQGARYLRWRQESPELKRSEKLKKESQRMRTLNLWLVPGWRPLSLCEIMLPAIICSSLTHRRIQTREWL